jgi:hypothetical protein
LMVHYCKNTVCGTKKRSSLVLNLAHWGQTLDEFALNNFHHL